MKILETQSAVKAYLVDIKNTKKTIGFVPTMGALHEGHLSLIKKAKKKTDFVIVSIFVNPTQFDNKEDLKKYPKTLESDVKLLKKIKCDAVYIPNADDVYDGIIETAYFDFDGLENQMEGQFRKGHFDGVGTVVKKLFEIVKPNIAFFGRKDFQQLQIIKKMVEKHNIPIKIVGCPIFREQDGLAMSSRNVRLTQEHRKEAPFIYKALKKARKKLRKKTVEEVTEWVKNKFKKHPLFELEYFTIADEETLIPTKIIEADKKYRAFIAVYVAKIRLIDNIKC